MFGHRLHAPAARTYSLKFLRATRCMDEPWTPFHGWENFLVRKDQLHRDPPTGQPTSGKPKTKMLLLFTRALINILCVCVCSQLVEVEIDDRISLQFSFQILLFCARFGIERDANNINIRIRYLWATRRRISCRQNNRNNNNKTRKTKRLLLSEAWQSAAYARALGQTDRYKYLPIHEIYWRREKTRSYSHE